MSTVKVIYGSSTGNTENAANAIAAQLGGIAVNAASASLDDFNADLLVLGTSTWGIGDLQDDWLGVLVIGRWDADGYSHSNSTALVDGKFAGLALDDDNENDKTPERIAKWCAQVKTEAGL